MAWLRILLLGDKRRVMRKWSGGWCFHVDNIVYPHEGLTRGRIEELSVVRVVQVVVDLVNRITLGMIRHSNITRMPDLAFLPVILI
jgi:hypothetical protein